MVPFGLTEKQFVLRYKKCLNKSSDFLINDLRKLFSLAVPPTVYKAEVEIFLNDGNDLVMPDAGIYFSGENNKVDQNDESVFPGRVVDLPLGTENIDAFDYRYFDDEKFDGKNLVADVVKAWFAECWWKAGGWIYPVSTTLHVHDDFGDGTLIELTEKKFQGK